jgi:hypothetical protein
MMPPRRAQSGTSVHGPSMASGQAQSVISMAALTVTSVAARGVTDGRGASAASQWRGGLIADG